MQSMAIKNTLWAQVTGILENYSPRSSNGCRGQYCANWDSCRWWIDLGLFWPHLKGHILSAYFKEISKRAPTIGNMVSPSLYNSHNQLGNWLSSKGFYRCGRNQCLACTHAKETQNIESRSNGQKFPIQICNLRFYMLILLYSIRWVYNQYSQNTHKKTHVRCQEQYSI